MSLGVMTHVKAILSQAGSVTFLVLLHHKPTQRLMWLLPDTITLGMWWEWYSGEPGMQKTAAYLIDTPPAVGKVPPPVRLHFIRRVTLALIKQYQGWTCSAGVLILHDYDSQKNRLQVQNQIKRGFMRRQRPLACVGLLLWTMVVTKACGLVNHPTKAVIFRCSCMCEHTCSE